VQFTMRTALVVVALLAVCFAVATAHSVADAEGIAPVAKKSTASATPDANHVKRAVNAQAKAKKARDTANSASLLVGNVDKDITNAKAAHKSVSDKHATITAKVTKAKVFRDSKKAAYNKLKHEARDAEKAYSQADIAAEKEKDKEFKHREKVEAAANKIKELQKKRAGLQSKFAQLDSAAKKQEAEAERFSREAKVPYSKL